MGTSTREDEGSLRGLALPLDMLYPRYSGPQTMAIGYEKFITLYYLILEIIYLLGKHFVLDIFTTKPHMKP